MTSDELQKQYDELCVEMKRAWKSLDVFRIAHLINMKAKVLDEWEDAREKENK